MKAILEFNLDDNDDRVSHLRAIKALDMALAISELDSKLRQIVKYGADDSMCHTTVSAIREELHNILENYNILLDELLI
jgi:hypothetical protein